MPAPGGGEAVLYVPHAQLICSGEKEKVLVPARAHAHSDAHDGLCQVRHDAVDKRSVTRVDLVHHLPRHNIGRAPSRVEARSDSALHVSR